MLSVLSHTIFRRLFAAQIVALLGTGLLTVALGLLAYDLAGSDAGAVLGTALAIKMLAYVSVAPVISALTCRVSRRTLLVGADIVRAGIALVLPFVGATWQIYVLIFVLQAASATFTPAFQSVIPTVLVDEKQYTRGLSLSRLAYDLESLLSPVLAAVLLSVLTYNYLFLGTVAGFVISALLVVNVAILPLAGTGTATESFWHRTTLGVRVMLRHPALRGLLAMNLAVAAATALVVVNTVVYVHDLLDGSSTGVALMLACYGCGSMVAALALPRMLDSVSDRRVMLTGAAAIPVVLAASAVLLFTAPGAATGWTTFIAFWLLMGAATSLINTPSARLLRYESTDDTRAAVFTAQFSLSHACYLVTYPVAGWLGAAAGQPIAAVALAGVALVAVLAAARLWPPSTPRPRDKFQKPATVGV